MLQKGDVINMLAVKTLFYWSITLIELQCNTVFRLMPELYWYNYFAINCCDTKLVYVHICFQAARVYRHRSAMPVHITRVIPQSCSNHVSRSKFLRMRQPVSTVTKPSLPGSENGGV